MKYSAMKCSAMKYSAMKPAPDVLVVGLGNTLRGDDALGRIVADRVRNKSDPSRVKVISQVALTPELAEEFSRVDLVVILDASIDGPTNQIQIHELAATELIDSMAHRIDARSLLGLSNHLYGHAPKAVTVTIGGEAFEFRDQQLISVASEACDAMVQETLDLIERHTSGTAHEN